MILRHALATLAYRGGKAIREAPAGFAEFKAGPHTRTPLEILAHIGDLMDWSKNQADGKTTWPEQKKQTWEQVTERFFTTLEALDRRLASTVRLGFPEEQIFQGPIADALTHVGQLTMLRTLYGSPIKGENYFLADIEAGRVGSEQAPPRREF